MGVGKHDYIAPQIYWPLARKVARYDVITRWWADIVRGTGTALYIVHGIIQGWNPFGN
ncbi:FenI family protein [Pantoea stewartii subsp. stewartii DC283]|uniref:FenI family protein n=1 Tax=Pantoea stewartii subsp. stewartii DC283 TaxID=660596 RepID=H3RL17_PANSE|nr:FenI family protein [Pantoea stewartii subsp. stewartii DC283]